MSQRPWWKSASIYQVYVRSFMDSNGDGIGDLPGVRSKLDYLSNLGINTIWLSPIHPSPNADFGYDVADYYGVHPDFGTLSDFEVLLAECKSRSIRMIMDLVVNHTSDEHPWFIESRSSLDNPKRDWYLWRPGKNGAVPNNWKSRVGDNTAWEFDPGTREFYMHSFFKRQPDLNWRNPEVRAEIKRIMGYWIDKGVSGFRLDVANYYLKDAQFRDNPTEWHFDSIFYAYDGQKHIHDKDQPDAIDIHHEMRELTDARDAVLFGEVDTDHGLQATLSVYGENNQGLQLAFFVDLLDIKSDPSWIRQHMAAYVHALGTDKYPILAFGSHDKPRIMTRVKRCEATAKLLAMLLLLSRGAAVIYYGDEIGMTDARVRYFDIVDPLGLKMRPFMWGRDGCRSPMQWNTEANAGFSQAKPWLPLAPNWKSHNVANEEAKSDSMLNTYRRLITLRKHIQTLGENIQTFVDVGNANVVVFKRMFSDRVLTVLLNFGKSPCTLPIDATQKIVFCTDVENKNTAISGGTLVLDGLSGIVLETQ